MSRIPDLIKFCQTHKLCMVTVDALAKYRMENEYDESLSTVFDLMPMMLRPLVPEFGALAQTTDIGVKHAP